MSSTILREGGKIHSRVRIYGDRNFTREAPLERNNCRNAVAYCTYGRARRRDGKLKLRLEFQTVS